MLGKDIPIECSIEDIDLKFLTLDRPSHRKIRKFAHRLAYERTKYCPRYPALRKAAMNSAQYMMGGKEIEVSDQDWKTKYECESQKLILAGEERGLFHTFVPFAYMRYSVVLPQQNKPIGFLSEAGNIGLHQRVQDFNKDLELEEYTTPITKWELGDYFPFNLYGHKGAIVHIHQLDSGIYSSLAQRMFLKVIETEHAELVEVLASRYYGDYGTNDDELLFERLGFVSPLLETVDYRKVRVWHPKIDAKDLDVEAVLMDYDQ